MRFRRACIRGQWKTRNHRITFLKRKTHDRNSDFIDLEDLIHSQRWEELRARLRATHSSDIAEAMGQIHVKEQAVVFRLLSRDQAAQVFSYLPAHRQKELLRALSTDEVKSVLDGMPPDDRTRFFEELPATVTRQLLEVLSPEELKERASASGLSGAQRRALYDADYWPFARR